MASDGTHIIEDGDIARPRGCDDRQWYREAHGSKDVHKKLVPYARMLLGNERNRHSKNRARERLYEGQELLNNRAAVAALEQRGVTIARLNATKSIVDTLVSRLSKDRPMPAIDTTDGDWYLKRRAHKFKQFIVGEMLATEYDDLSRESLLDGGIYGYGFTHIYDDDEGVGAERVPVNEMLFDERECRYGKPRQGIRVMRIARDYLAEEYPEHKNEIACAAPSVRRPDDEQRDLVLGSLEGYVDVFIGWHLPLSSDDETGHHAVCIENATLLSERWYEPRFPWTMYRMFKPRLGLMAPGVVDQLASLQHRVNCIVRDIQLNLAATGRGHFLVNENNDIPVEMLTGWQPFKLKYKGGQPPTYVAPQPFSQAQLNALEYFIDKMYDLSGVSRANAESKSALGPGASGIALDTQYDIDSDRFRLPQANYARSRLDAGQAYIDAAARVARRRKSAEGKKRPYVATTWKTRDVIEKLDWDKVSLSKDQYKLKLEPENFLPNTKAGKLSAVEQLAKAGVIPQWLVPSLFDEPDLVQANGLLLAPFRNAMRKMDILLDEDKPIPLPEKYNDLELELKIVTAYYNRVQEEEAPDEVQDRFRQYADLVADALQKTKPPPAPAPPMDPAQEPLPGGVPAMPAGPVPAPEMIGAL